MPDVKLLIRNAVLTGYVELVRLLGGDLSALLAAVGLDASDLAVPHTWIPVAAAADLIELSAAATGHDDFGLQLAESRRLSVLGPVSLVAREEPDVRSALEVIMRHQHLHNEALHSRITETNGLATIQLGLDLPSPRRRQTTELLVGAIHRYLRSLVGSSWRPVSVLFAHEAPTDAATHHRVLGPAVRFGQDLDGIVLYASDLDAPNQLSDPLLRPYARQYLEAIAAPRPEADVDRVRELIEALLPTGRCSLQQVAHSLGVDRKTIHRHLARSGETFSSVLNSLRTQLAQQYVGSHARPLTQVATLLGFSAPSTFSRWFREEFGTSPTAWRAAAARPEQPRT
ncbi:AraC family transcriptional regulator [Streptomyces kronopolitis]|uniref:AraC family transcriptional regulator n=1 Tax=Streptomyces kronopolitis TaxID=1612435 RepID=UPI0020BFA42C|nr:AraC family transcriptional regulator [Streptomyces kronopolitis]MCL6300798.1 AraC family transcriptional regulator [Streptomyces kronopolitis]